MAVAVKKIIAAGAACTGAVALLAGCGSEDGTATAVSADPARVHELVLDAADFPAGYTAQSIPRDEMQETIDLILESGKSAKITPAQCKQMSAVPEGVDFDGVGLIIATDQQKTLSESVAVEPGGVAEYRSQIEGGCERMSMEISVQWQTVTSEMEQKIVAAPETSASDAMFVEVTTTAKTGGHSVEQTTFAGYAEVAGYLVTVQSSSVPPSQPDRAAFEEMFVKAVEKVADNA